MSGPATMRLPSPLAALRARLLAEARNEATRGAALSLAIKIAMSALNLVMLTLIARALAGHEFGTFALWYNALVFLTVVAGLGQEKMILRQWGEYAATREWGLARGSLGFGAAVTGAGAALAALAVLAVGHLSGSDPHLALAGAAFLVVQTLFFFTAHINRAMLGVVQGVIHELTWRAVVIAAMAAFLILHRTGTATEFFVVATIGMGIGLLAQLIAIRHGLPAELRTTPRLTQRRAWARRSLPMAMGGNLEAATQYLEVFVVGLVLSPAAAGAYFVAARIANLFLMISGGMDAFTTRQIPRQFYGEGRGAVAGTLRRLALIVSAPVLVGLLGIVLFGRPILSIFGEGFVASYGVLVALSVGTAILALAGPAMPVLTLTGHEGTYSLVLGATLALRLSALIAGAWFWGPMGAAVASAAGAAVTAVALNLACRRTVGLDPAVTSLLALGRIRP